MKAVHELAQGEDRDRFIRILETSLQVHKSSQFFGWTQGPLRSLLPHEILICGHTQPGHRDLKLRYFTSTRYFKKEHFEAASNPRHGLIANAVRHWRTVRRPCLLPTPPGMQACDIATEEVLVRLELKNLAAHGLTAPDGGVQSWFGLARVHDLGARTAHLLDLLMPALSATYARVVASEGGQSEMARLEGILTAREVQVLELVRDGLSNADVAERLSLSVMTAKNHVQNIRRKLNVHTRGQAVAESIRRGLIRSAGEVLDDPAWGD